MNEVSSHNRGTIHHTENTTMNTEKLQEKLLARFLRYAETGTQSDPEKADAGIMPSTETQRAFAHSLAEELRSFGIPSVTVDEHSYLLAYIAPSPGFEDRKAFGLCSHLDTASDAPGAPVRPIVHKNYRGGKLELPGGVTLDPETDPDLAGCVGGTIITSDGNTLLGADDKAGIAGIMTLAEFLSATPEFKHGPVEILFSPDEETGHGMDRVPLEKLKAKAYYTIDGGSLGEIEAECFNAWKCSVELYGVAAHLGAAKGKLVNAALMAAVFASMLPRNESPEATEGYDGYYCPLEISGRIERASVSVFLRDFEARGISRRIECVESLARAVEKMFPGGKAVVSSQKQYANMAEKLKERPEIFNLARRAVELCGVTPSIKPIRGGTDGSRLSEMGMPTPNIFTGGHNFHSRTEWASLAEMTKMTEILIKLTELWSETYV